MRGKPVCTGRNFPPYWITPAGAGKTAKCKADSRPPKDHPRRCGENSLNEADCSDAPGSPPQVRGKPSRRLTVSRSSWITPAGAGKTRSQRTRRRSRWDHPRRCGENSYAVTRFSSILGSPPQVRGKPSSPVTSVNPPQDHPRRCGENSLSSSSCRSRSGSPPQVRGKPEFHLLSLRYRRITPAGAGKTWLFGFLWCVRWDHPRRCGENVITCISGAGISGSPPQVRGKLSVVTPVMPEAGITPAGAGKTSKP